ncbi:MAG: enoyl-CoA hydratase/isomerase family protein [Streptosporangiales bacterium]|nr:enoyl-CoA hydratase/isomerase family protein [Streptosporangiales bacterium]
MAGHVRESSAVLECAVDAGVAVVRLNRPAARNALCRELVDDLDRSLAELDADEAVGAVVLAGASPGFCAGSDLRELGRMDVREMAHHEARAGQVARAVAQLGTPVVAAVEGFAIGGGFLLALACDLVVTTAAARWHLPEVQLGWVPPWGIQALVARGGPTVARRLAWGDEPSTGADLHRLGVVDELAAPDDALDVAVGIASRLAAFPPAAVAATKRALADSASANAETLDARTNWMFAQNCESGAARHSLDRFRVQLSEESP